MASLLASLWREPRPPQPEGRRGSRADVALVVVFAVVAIVEGVVSDVPQRPLAIGSALVIIALLGWRRSHAFVVFCGAFGVAVGVDAIAALLGVPFHGLSVNAVILLLPYALFRWGSGREGAAGVLVLAAVYAWAAATHQMKDDAERVAAAVVLLLPAAIGASVRFRAQAQRREVEAARAVERQRLARDLHDTVAHHVSAIAVQAQAGRVVAAKNPAAAERALAVIEEEASRALTDLRALVGILRDREAPLAPEPGLADVAELARTLADGRVVDVALTGDLSDVRPALAAAVFRIAQEGVTNAVRHARNAARISVRVSGDADAVTVRVDDDGAPAAPGQGGGFGLAGMKERVALLGGTFEAGARPAGGWRVEAVFARARGAT